MYILQNHQGYLNCSMTGDFVSSHPNVGDIPSFKLFESDSVLAFLDIQPLSYGHAVRR